MISRSRSFKWYILPIISQIFMVLLFAVPGKTQETPHGSLHISCTDCHDINDWKKIRPDSPFRHDATRFPLIGQHRSVSCKTCHTDFFSGTPRECSQCHQDIHNGELGKDCSRCHQPVTFAKVSDADGFHETTRFPLRGFHRTLDCTSCHKDTKKGTWRGLDTSCVSCHIRDYNAAKKPDHRASGIGTDCARCHTETSAFTSFEHSTSRFPLTGAHVQVSCAQCHTSETFTTLLPTACNSCHGVDYQKTTQPNHQAAKFALTCETCHTTQAWLPANYNHSTTGYTLTGAHVTVSCNACHKNNVFAGTPTACATCHETSYTVTTNPGHIALKFPRTCETCHTTAGWVPATFNHSASSFPLTGAHAQISCAKCHTDNYAGTLPTRCYDCHTAVYSTAKEHKSLLFPQDCTQCHSATAWMPITFKHSAFAIYSGEHRGKWQNCSDCHTIPGNFQQYSCTKCHSNGTPRD